MRKKIEFNSEGQKLAGLIEVPPEKVKAFILFAHCFTCGKDIAAASRIARALVQKGYGVLRFDFTGLGNSDGDFANTNFSSNIDDIENAANFLRDNYQAPQVLIGHSLGGIAVLSVANRIPECNAVVAISSPASADHVIKNFSYAVNDIAQNGEACVTLGPRTFNIKQQFIEDVKTHHSLQFSLSNKALLVMHSPLDTIVSINEAEKIYQWAKHPKSFISLDKADHLISDNIHAEYAANAIAGWVSKYVISDNTDATYTTKGTVIVEERDHKFTQTIVSDNHIWLADEPQSIGGNNLGPDPYEHLLASLGACTSITIRMYATRKKIPLTNIKVTLVHSKNYVEDSKNCESQNAYAEKISRVITLSGELSEEQTTKLMEIADKCPVHKTLHSKIIVDTQLDKQ